GDFRAITITQHLLGLGAGGLLLLTWQRTRVFISETRRTGVLHCLLGLAAAAICLTAGGPINTEMQIRPEGISAFLLGLNIHCTRLHNQAAGGGLWDFRRDYRGRARFDQAEFRADGCAAAGAAHRVCVPGPPMAQKIWPHWRSRLRRDRSVLARLCFGAFRR